MGPSAASASPHKRLGGLGLPTQARWRSQQAGRRQAVTVAPWASSGAAAAVGTPATTTLERADAASLVASAPPARSKTASAVHSPEPLLAYELVQGALVRYSSLPGGRAPPTAVLVHGILGKRQNMLSFARRLVEGFPQWQVVVVDLRCHGESAAISSQLRGSHGVEAAANDVIKLLSALKLFPEMLIGHSFGGKVALQMTHHWSQTARRVPRPVQVWVLDALPGEVRSGDMGGSDRPADLISTLQQVPLPVSSRHWLISHLEAAGFSRQVSAWAATNLVPATDGGAGLVWGFDLTGIAQMFRSYETTNLWPLLASPADGVQLSFVKAERSTFRWGGGDEARIRTLGHAVHLLPNSGHWVHTDNPDGLFDILAPSFGGQVDLHMQRSPNSSPQNSPRASRPIGAANNITPSGAGARQLHGLMM